MVEVSTSKTGKHGHAKCHFVALDIFTNRKMEELVPSSHNLEARAGSRSLTASQLAVGLAPPPRGLPQGRSSGPA